MAEWFKAGLAFHLAKAAIGFGFLALLIGGFALYAWWDSRPRRRR